LDLTVIIPTFEERENVAAVTAAIEAVFADGQTTFEVLFVDDDSPDGTWQAAAHLEAAGRPVRVIRRVGRSGLASAVVEGFFGARGEYVAVMDADLQHDESILPRMLAAAREGADVAVGSRYCGDGGVGEWNARRAWLSRLATRLAGRVLGNRTTDPMSGFFLCGRETAERVSRRAHTRGFKILAALLAADAGLRVADVPYVFRDRLHGESKLTGDVGEEYLEFLFETSLGRYVPLRFAKYCIVGALGAIVHTTVLIACWKGLAWPVSSALIAGIESAIVFNFALNNRWTFLDRRATGLQVISALVRYHGVCAIGALSTYGLSWFLLDREWPWIVAVPVGASVGSVWNYAMSLGLAWPGSRKHVGDGA